MITPLSARLAQGACDLEDSEDLGTLGGVVETTDLIDALDHAAAIAAEVEREAARTAPWAGPPLPPAYPPLLLLLGRALVDAAHQRRPETSLETCSCRHKPAPTGSGGRPRAAADQESPAPGGAR